MEREFSDYQNYNMQNGFPNNSFNGFDPNMNDIYKDPMFNPIMQYEQAYSYYKYLCMQIDYKIKCKEYEKICAQQKNNA